MKPIVYPIRVALAGLIALWFAACSNTTAITPSPTPTETPTPAATSTPTATIAPVITPTPDDGVIIGTSVEGRPIRLYRFGEGRPAVLLVGGMHGGYEWNTVALAYDVIDLVREHPAQFSGATLLIVPDANPDGLYAVSGVEGRAAFADIQANTVRGRLNANGVDLNRNWDCRWQPSGEWGGTVISGGSHPFSEPETRALRDLILRENADAVVFWHSAYGAVLGGGCGDHSAFDSSKTLARDYALAAGYAGADTASSPGSGGYGGLQSYDITGDASDWVSSLGIPSITVELSSHTATELAQNLAGIHAIIQNLSAHSR